MEIELKYRLRDAAAGERFLAADVLGPFKATAAARTAQHEDRYLDTSDGALARAGFAARLRQTNTGTIVSVKSTRGQDGPLARREELEGPADRTADPRDWPASDARSLIMELCGDAPLVELVTVRQLRRRRRLKAPDAAVELSLDEVDVVARGRVIDRFAELEIELMSGEESRLTELQALFEGEDGLTPARGSKLEAALAASGGADGHADVGNGTAGSRSGRGRRRGSTPASGRPSVSAAPGTTELDLPTEHSMASNPVLTPGGDLPPAPAAAPLVDEVPEPAPLVVGKTAGVVAEDVLGEAGRKVLRFHLARMLAKEAGTREGKDSEDLHSMRVATRRMRAAWRIFGDGFRGGRTRRYRRRLREVASRLGAVRDLDVLIDAGESYLATQTRTEQLALQPLFTAWRGQREEARRLLVHELDSDAYLLWVEEYRDFVRSEGAGIAGTTPTAPHRIRDTAPSRVWQAYEQVRAYEPVLRWADVATLHELRIAAKWLRYTLEFVRECLGPDAPGLIARVTALQDHLGLMHDADVAASMTRTFLVERAGRLSETETAAIARYLVDREREVGRLRRTVARPWRGISGLAFRRGLGRALAVL